jgi:hypothetical protein
MACKRPNLRESESRSENLTPRSGLSREQAAQRIAESLRFGLCPGDLQFDRFLGAELQVVSGQHWTPLVVVRRAAAWFCELNVGTVTDIGSGSGKFCVAAALAGRCQFIGLEQRPRLVAAARELAHLFQVDNRVRFTEGTFGQISTPVTDVYYLYNPFGENLLLPAEQLDKSVELSTERYFRDIAAAEELLLRAPTGTYVLTYNGFGGWIPASYHEVRVARDLPNDLRMWKKASNK